MFTRRCELTFSVGSSGLPGRCFMTLEHHGPVCMCDVHSDLSYHAVVQTTLKTAPPNEYRPPVVRSYDIDFLEQPIGRYALVVTVADVLLHIIHFPLATS